MRLKELHRLLWLTDLHLADASSEEFKRFVEDMAVQAADTIAISGDISDGYHFVKSLREIHQLLFRKKIYFVLGNHDYYHSSIYDTRKIAENFSEEVLGIEYLTCSGVHALTEKTAILGHDGWADGRFGDYYSSKVLLRDFFAIEDFIGISAQERLKKMQLLGDEAVEHFQKYLPEAFQNYERVILVTHVPPFFEACLFKEKLADSDWGPFFICKKVGEVLIEIMEKYSHCKLLVLCGHSHHKAHVKIRQNLSVLTGGARVEFPEVQELITVDEFSFHAS